MVDESGKRGRRYKGMVKKKGKTPRYTIGFSVGSARFLFCSLLGKQNPFPCNNNTKSTILFCPAAAAHSLEQSGLYSEVVAREGT